ncbi:tetratricopeptide repeat protein [Streptomyces melanogenes]|uniref:tetratricopeptide repeat protein n=1 Tax=Streptomyces melanogenes TaxID=67326 RepID=UPI00379F820A
MGPVRHRHQRYGGPPSGRWPYQHARARALPRPLGSGRPKRPCRAGRRGAALLRDRGPHLVRRREHQAQNLAVLLNRQGRTAEAEALWVRAAEAGNAGAAVHLGFLRHEAGDLKEAERWWRESAERGNSQGAYYFGVLLARSGRTDEAERWWRQAAGRLGDPENFTGSRISTQSGFGYALVRAADSGEALCAYQLACLLDEKGDRAGAERWWAAAARAGHIEAVLQIAQVAMNDHDDLDGCLYWLRIAVADERTPVDRLATAADRRRAALGSRPR